MRSGWRLASRRRSMLVLLFVGLVLLGLAGPGDGLPIVTSTTAVRVAASGDDASETTRGNDSGAVSVTGGLSLGQDIVGLRFAWPDTLKRARILEAEIVFTARAVPVTGAGLKVSIKGSTQAGAFTATPLDVSKRGRTKSEVKWDVAPVWMPTFQYRTPDLTKVVKELQAEADSLVFVFTRISGDPKARPAASFDLDPATAPALIISFESDDTMPTTAPSAAAVTTSPSSAPSLAADGIPDPETTLAPSMSPSQPSDGGPGAGPDDGSGGDGGGEGIDAGGDLDKGDGSGGPLPIRTPGDGSLDSDGESDNASWVLPVAGSVGALGSLALVVLGVAGARRIQRRRNSGPPRPISFPVVPPEGSSSDEVRISEPKNCVKLTKHTSTKLDLGALLGPDAASALESTI